MNIMQLSSRFSATGQISEGDLAKIAAKGFKSVINNRPDGEGGPEQPKSADLAIAAEAVGLIYRYIPVVSGSITQQNIDSFAEACENLDGPTLLFCQSGARSTMLLYLSGMS